MKNKIDDEDFNIIDVIYPNNFIEIINKKGEYDFKKLSGDGMVICLESILKKDKDNCKYLKEIPESINETFNNKTICVDLDEIIYNFKEGLKFKKESGVFPDGFLYWTFMNVVITSELFNPKKIKELDEYKESGKGQPTSQFHARVWQIENKESEKINREHWILVLSSHKSLMDDSYLNPLLRSHKEKMRNIGKRKNIKKSNGRNPITKSIRHEVFVRDNYKCIECGTTNKEGELVIDHIIPVSRGGTDEMSNLQTLCKTCNQSKSNRIYKSGP